MERKPNYTDKVLPFEVLLKFIKYVVFHIQVYTVFRSIEASVSALDEPLQPD